eukprot:scaffold5479_cov199-Amphora_coffeaeformis.AAC.39
MNRLRMGINGMDHTLILTGQTVGNLLCIGISQYQGSTMRGCHLATSSPRAFVQIRPFGQSVQGRRHGRVFRTGTLVWHVQGIVVGVTRFQCRDLTEMQRTHGGLIGKGGQESQIVG